MSGLPLRGAAALPSLAVLQCFLALGLGGPVAFAPVCVPVGPDVRKRTAEAQHSWWRWLVRSYPPVHERGDPDARRDESPMAPSMTWCLLWLPSLAAASSRACT